MKRTIRFPKRKYKIIYADPAYSFSDKNTGGNHKSGASNKYKTISIYEICSLPVRQIASKNSFLFLWIPDSLLPEAMKIFDAWGFKYKKKAFTWIKLTRKGLPFFGMGRTTRNGSEDLYLGIRGKPKIKHHNVRQVQFAQIEKHSTKPDLFRKEIINLCGNVPKIELFARKKVKFWDAWGDQVKKSKH